MKRNARNILGRRSFGSLARCFTGMILLMGLQMSTELNGQSSQNSTRETAKAAEPSISTGPEVGQRIPNFRLQDQNGRMQDLNSIVGPKGAAIYFNRSADW